MLLTLVVCALWGYGAIASARAPQSTTATATSRSADKKRTKAERRAAEKREKERAAAAKAAPTRPGTGPGGEAPASDAAVAGPTGIPSTGDPKRAPAATGPTATGAGGALEVPSADEVDVPSDFEGGLLEAETDPPAGGAEDDAATLLADSLAAYESAQELWEQGLADEAFATLDHAYQLMADVDIAGDPLRAQEKEDLRRLISRRVIEIYASRPTAAGDVEGSIPLEINEHVEREIKSFSGPERKFFLESYARSGQFRPMILEELRAAGMPLELAWMPLVESGFKVRAYSVARALGLWQFIPSTGYRFGLERSNWIDERMDPHKSTKAAIGYLTELHSLFGDWLTALAAYNCGEHLVLRLLSSQPVSYFDQFWDLYLRLPRETRRYVPRFLAVTLILQDPTAYGFTLPELQRPQEFDIVRTERIADLGELEKRLQLPDGTIKGLNPELRRNATPSDPYDVKVPRGTVDQVAAAITQLPQRVATADVAPAGGSSSGGSATTHRVRPGDTLGRVASRYGTSVDALVRLNGLKSADRITPGQTLRVRASERGGGSGRSTSSSSSSHSASTSGDGTTTHRVRQGDNLWVIAQRYGTTVERIKSDNALRGNLLKVGQKLVINGSRTATGAG
jgi:membrane-bound lytic murein transglycosylase D